MKVEIPTFTRCCICIPLRYGIIVWAYIKLICNILTFMLTLVFEEIEATFFGAAIYVTITLAAIDFVLLIVLIYGAHTKKVPVLKVYYYYGLGATVIFLIGVITLVIIQTVLTVQEWDGFSVLLVIFYVAETSILIFFIMLHINLMLLLRSEILKLQENSVFKFVTKTEHPNAGDTEKEIQVNARYDRFQEDV